MNETEKKLRAHYPPDCFDAYGLLITDAAKAYDRPLRRAAVMAAASPLPLVVFRCNCWRECGECCCIAGGFADRGSQTMRGGQA